ncbi:MAG: LysR family transcriptional regulator [Gammaproteobacteria bacterium]|nr:LysR family transcriptional regulator [Gammaproteobacteria bacterium]
MNLSSLQAFIKVAELGSFSAAAEELFLTQPAVSKRIAQLEEELGVQLFDRIGHRISITEAGKTLLPGAARIIEEVKDTQRQVANLSGEIRGALRIGTSHHIGLHRLPPSLKAFTRNYPEVELDIRFMDSEAACQQVSHGELELAVVTLPSKPDAELECMELWDDLLVPVASKDHPLARSQAIKISELCQHPAILPGTGTFTRVIVENAFSQARQTLNVALETNYLETILMMVSIGLGWSILPVSMLSDNVKTLKVPELELHRQLGLVTHKERTLSNAAQAFASALHDA